MRTVLKNTKWAGLSVLLVSSAANAALVPVLTSATPGPATNTTFNYTLNFSTGQLPGGQTIERLDPGDFVTIYDIPGFISATAPTGFSVSTPFTGVNGFQTTPNADSAAIPNVVFTYTGSSTSANTNFINALIVSSNSGTATGQFSSEDTGNLAATSGQPIGQIGPVTVPAVPEPALLGLGAFGAMALLRRRQ